MKKIIYILPVLLATFSLNTILEADDVSNLYSFDTVIENGISNKINNPFDPISYKTTCFKSGENTSGMSKTCYYNCTCGTKALNRKSTQLCPLSAKFEC